MAVHEYIREGREPVFQVCSQGIGKRFAIENAKQIRENMCVTRNGIKHAIPRYYCKILDIDVPLFPEGEADDVQYHTGQKLPLDRFCAVNSSTEVAKLYKGLLESRSQAGRNIDARMDIRMQKRKKSLT